MVTTSIKRSTAAVAAAAMGGSLLVPVVVGASSASAATGPLKACASPAYKYKNAADHSQGTEPIKKIPVSSLTYKELNERYVLKNGENIPKLDDVLKYANSAGVGVLPEIKSFGKQVSQGQVNQYIGLIKKYPNLYRNKSRVLIGTFDPAVLEKFKTSTDPRVRAWQRIWFRGAGPIEDTSFVQPMAPPVKQEMDSPANTFFNILGIEPWASMDNNLKPYVMGMYQNNTGGTGGAANALGVINIGWTNASAEGENAYGFAPNIFINDTFKWWSSSDSFKNTPVYIWYNTMTKGDSPADGPDFSPMQGVNVKSPGWDAVTDAIPDTESGAKAPVWIATDDTAGYKNWRNTRAQQSKDSPDMVAHRGGGVAGVGYVPPAKPNTIPYIENSMQAFKRAVSNDADYLEFDIGWTKDGVPVIFHDSYINRVVNCRVWTDQSTSYAGLKGAVSKKAKKGKGKKKKANKQVVVKKINSRTRQGQHVTVKVNIKKSLGKVSKQGGNKLVFVGKGKKGKFTITLSAPGKLGVNAYKKVLTVRIK